MSGTSRRMMQVLAGTILGGGIATKAYCGAAKADESRPWGSSYIKLGAKDASVIADRAVMNRLYVEDIRKLGPVVPRCPNHTPLVEQPSYKRGGSANLRILTWNINMLCGPDGSASVGSHKRINPDHVAEVIQQTNADIICLQETIDWMPPEYKDFFEKRGVGELDERMRRLNARLKEQGFGTLLRSCSPPSEGSPNLVASRIPVVHSETLTLAPEIPDAKRSAAYIEVGLTKRNTRTLGVYSTHLHHIDQQPVEGRRAAEMTSLLEHAAGRAPPKAKRLATVVTGDFNQARSQDYAPAEWSVVRAALSKVGQPEDDGVSRALREAGFVCAYDASARSTNFGGRSGAPAFTHWTGTVVDYLYLLNEDPGPTSDTTTQRTPPNVLGTYVVFSDLSDHLPIVTDLAIDLPAPSLESL